MLSKYESLLRGRARADPDPQSNLHFLHHNPYLHSGTGDGNAGGRARQAEELTRLLDAHTRHHVDILQSLAEGGNLPAEAMQGIATALENAMRGREEAAQERGGGPGPCRQARGGWSGRQGRRLGRRGRRFWKYGSEGQGHPGDADSTEEIPRPDKDADQADERRVEEEEPPESGSSTLAEPGQGASGGRP